EDFPIEVSCEAFSPFIRGDEKHSALPVAIFRFKLNNPTSRSMTASLMLTLRNLIGEWCVGRFNQVIDTQHALHLFAYNKKCQSHDPANGEMCLTFLKKKNIETSYLGEWNMQSKHFVFDKTSFAMAEAWDAFAQEGLLPNVNLERLVQSESFQMGGAIAARTVLKPKSSVTVTVMLSWYFPGYGEGHMYEAWFRNVADVANYTMDRTDDLYRQTKEGAGALQALKLEPWLKDALANNLYPLISGSLWTKKGRFGLFESPEVCPLLGTLDVGFYGTLPLAFFFPTLELRQMMQFADAQRPQGYIPHDLGFKRSDLASNSTNGLLWKDLNAKFILLAYRDFLFTRDENFLKKLYPFLRKAYYWLVAADKNKDFLPDHEGADQTFDCWEFYGASSYGGGIFLASLLALEKIALHLQDEPTRKEVAAWYKKARISFEKKLWYKSFFLGYNNNKEGLTQHQVSHCVKSQKVSIACMAAQLVGQWAAHFLGLGYIVSQDKVHRAVETMLKLNAQASSFGAVNAVLPSGERDKTNWQSENVWFGMTYVLASLAVYEGFEKEGLDLAKRAWDNATVNIANPWNQADMVSSSDGSYLFGDHYMRNMVIWSLLWPLAKKNKALEAFLKEPQK
ncbi:MAG: GH116 family glycosyl hydrolase, partial [Candidatus Omnitrophota bacterium]